MSVPHASGQAVSTYLEQEIRSESPLALVARLYDMAGLEIARARAAIAEQNWQQKGMAVRKAGRCISLLQCTLNREKGKEVAANLDRIYSYLLRRISEGHVSNDLEIFSEIARHLSELGSAWREAANREVTPAVAAPVVTPPATAEAAR